VDWEPPQNPGRFTGTRQHNGHLPAHHLDFLATGGYVLAPPSTVGGKPYRILWEPGGRGDLNWDTATRILQPRQQHQQARRQAQASSPDLGHLARWSTPASVEAQLCG
jgi:hypothetical protein